MNINSLSFLLFCVITLAAYFALQNTGFQKYVLLIADGVLFVSLTGYKSLIVAALIATLVFLIAVRIEKCQSVKIRKCLMWFGVIISLGTLVFFKFFTGLLSDVITRLFSADSYLLPVLVPVGIAYYSLSMSGYIIDVYHKKYPAETDYFAFLGFIFFFPSLVEGPINLYKKMIGQIKENHTFDWDRTVRGLQRILWGYVKKVVIADRIGIIVMGILKDPSSHGSLTILALLLYSFQIYADFSGGIDVVMGVSEIMGYTLTENFRAPLLSKSVTEYWQRWHKSLGDWMEKYIYYPIVLNRKMITFSKKIKSKYYSKAFSAIVASIVVFVIVGIWHGTGWNYVLYGVYQAIFVSSAIVLAPAYKAIKQKLHVNEESMSWTLFCIIRTFGLLTFGRMLIKAANMAQIADLISRMMYFDNIGALFDGSIYKYGLDFKNWNVMILGIVLLVVVDILNNKKIYIRDYLAKQDIVFRYAVYLIGLFAIIILGIYGDELTAASFIYAGF